MRRLIINADDFGLTSGVNRAIAESHDNGIVTSTTLMASSDAFAGAVEIARSMPRLSVGCHAMLVDGQPLLPREKVATLVNAEGRFPLSFGAIAKSALRQKIAASEIEAEVSAQIEKIQSAGIKVTHVDSHKHVHMVPKIGGAIVRAARNVNVRAIRNPFVPIKAIAFAHLAGRPKLWKRYTQTSLLRHFHDEFRRQVADAGMITTDGSFGVISTGSLDMDLFRAILGSIPDGTWEFVCHPGYNDAELGDIRTRLRQSRERELAILTSDDVKQTIAEYGIELISYSDLTGAQ